MPTAAVRTTVILVTWRGAGHVGACLDALAAQRRAHHVLVIDNASDDGTADVIAAHALSPEVLRLPRNTGYAGGIAAGCARARTSLVAWLNDDARPEPGWLAALEDALEADVGAVAATLVDSTGTVRSAGGALTGQGYGADTTAPVREPFAFCGGAALLRTDALRAVGGVPERFFCYYEDTDTAWRLRLAGWRVTHTDGAVAAHLHGASTRLGSAAFHRWNERNRLLMLLRCAPASVAVRELARFTALTVVLPARANKPTTPNFRFASRCRVLAEVVWALVPSLRQRRYIGAISRVGRTRLWRHWADG